MTRRERAQDILVHYLTQNGRYGDRDEASAGVDAVIDAALEQIEARLSAIERRLHAIDIIHDSPR